MNQLINKIPFMLLLIFFSCTAQENINLGSKMDKYLPSTSKILIPSGALVEAATYSYDKSLFTIGMNQDRVAVYVSTVDPNFEVNGFRINDELLKKFENSKVHYITGWGYYIQIDADWFAGFDVNLKPTEKSKIQWFFKYKFSEGNKNLFEE